MQDAPKKHFSNECVAAALIAFRRALATISLSDWKKETLLTAMEEALRSNVATEDDERAFCAAALAEFDFELDAPPTTYFEQTLCDLSFELRETRLDAEAPSLRELRRRWNASNETDETDETDGGLFGGSIDASGDGGSLGNGKNGRNAYEPNEGDRVRIRVEFANGASASADYAIGAIVGEGGQKRVYTLRQEGTGRRLALKQAINAGRRVRRNFAQEAKTQGLLEHPNIPTLFWADASPDGAKNEPPILIESFVPGEAWSDRTFDRESRDENLSILLKIATITAYAHREAGVVHRDLKPANVMLGKYDEIYLCDWGLAGLAETEARSGGTLAFAAPEQLRGEPVDFRADVFSLGAILYKILAGVAPRGETGKYGVKALYERAKAGAIDMLPPDAAPSELRIIALKALSRDPAERYADAGEFAEALTKYLRRAKVWERFEKLTFRLKGLHEVFETANWEKTEEARDVWAIRFNVYGGLLNELTALRKETDDAASENADDRDLTATLLDVEINARGHLLNMMTKTHDFTMATALLSEYKKATTRRFEISGDKKQLQTDEYRYRLWKRYIDVGARKIKQRSWMETWGFILAILIMIGIFSHLIIWNAFLQQLEDDRAERLKIQREQGVETGRFYF